jgi:hypothetical protein
LRQASPSFLRATQRTPGSTWRKVSNATSSPANTQSAFIRDAARHQRWRHGGLGRDVAVAHVFLERATDDAR